MAQKHKLADRAQRHIQIGAAIQALVRKGLLVDSGKRRWSKRTKCYQIVWVLAGSCETLH
jgi:hypothetical protein